MKKQAVRFLAVICVMVLCIGSVNAFESSIEASDYFNYYDAWVTADGKDIIISFDVDTKVYASQIGASVIIVQERSGNGWIGVSTYFGSLKNDMLTSNSCGHNGKISYVGTSGKEYRAQVTFYAEDSSGNDSRTVFTNSVTAK